MHAGKSEELLGDLERRKATKVLVVERVAVAAVFRCGG